MVKSKMNKKIVTIKQNFPSEIYEFYYRIYKLISVINDLYNKNKITNQKDIEKYVINIKSIHAFEHKTDYDIINLITSEYDTSDDDNDLIKIPKNPVGISNNNTNTIVDNFSNVLAPGQLNSLKRITQVMNLNLNSCFRNDYYTSSSSDFQY